MATKIYLQPSVEPVWHDRTQICTGATDGGRILPTRTRKIRVNPPNPYR